AQRRHRMVKLPPAMIGDHHSIDTAFARDAGILRGNQALYHELSLPAPAYQFDMLPGELVAIADIAYEILGEDGWAARRVHILEMRHAVIFQRAHPGAEQPMRMRRYIPGDPRCDPERDLEAGADVVLAVQKRTSRTWLDISALCQNVWPGRAVQDGLPRSTT